MYIYYFLRPIEIDDISFFVCPVEIVHVHLLKYFSLSFSFIIYGPTIHYIISTIFSPSLLLYQLYIKFRANLK